MSLVAHVPSFSTPGRSHEVVREGDVVGCACPAFSFSGRRRTCSHVDLVRRADHLLERCADRHGVDPAGKLCRQCLVELLALATRKVRQQFIPKAEAKAKVAAVRQRRGRKRRA